jgi:hypothetical protein
MAKNSHSQGQADSESEDWYFIWVLNHACEPRPQKWNGLDFGERNWRRRSVVAVKKLRPTEFRDSLDVLAAQYPVHLCDQV